MHYCHWCRKLIERYPAELATTNGVKKFHAGPLKDCMSIYERWTKDLQASTREGGS